MRLRRDRKTVSLVRQNVRLVKALYPELAKRGLSNLRSLTRALGLSVAKGELLYISPTWYVTHGGLLQIASRRRCAGIHTVLQERISNPGEGHWIFKATVTKCGSAKFSSCGDANPSNVSPLVRGAEMRVAETRAVNRALRKAYGIGLCSAEELGWEPRAYNRSESRKPATTASSNCHHNAQTSLRDRLCLLIRQHQLDANLVKSYAVDSCGTSNLRDATREQIETFIANLSDWATRDRPALLCKLNSYAKAPEVTS